MHLEKWNRWLWYERKKNILHDICQVPLNKNKPSQTLFIRRKQLDNSVPTSTQSWPSVQPTCMENPATPPSSSRLSVTARTFSLTSLLLISMWHGSSYSMQKAMGARRKNTRKLLKSGWVTKAVNSKYRITREIKLQQQFCSWHTKGKKQCH